MADWWPTCPSFGLSRPLFGFGCLAALLCSAPAWGQTPFRFPAAKNGTAELRLVNTIPVLSVSGTPEQIGAGVGELALRPAARVLDYPRDLLEARRVGKLWNYFLGAGKGMYRHFPDDYRQELDAMASAARVDRDLVIVGNTLFDIKKFLACSAVLVEKEKSATGGPLLARNLDYPSLGYIHQYSLVTAYRPRGRLAFATIGFPGLVGVLSGMNEAGLALGVLEVFDIKQGEDHFDIKGTPYGLCLRRVLEEARTIEQAERLLRKMKRTTTINVAIADRHGVGVLEVTPRHVVRREASRGVCVTCNHFCSAPLKPEKPVNVDRSFERFADLEAVRAWKEKATPDRLCRQLDLTNLGTLTLQTMVFEPATLKLHLSIGKVPASKGPLKTIDLQPLLRPAKGAGPLKAD